MKVMVIVKAAPSSEAGKMPSPELLTAMRNFNQELVNAGIMESGDGLKPSKDGFRVKFSGDKRLVTTGPFTETNELIAGYWVWNVSSMEEALEWVKKCPNPMEEDSEIEIRPFYSMEDFASLDPDGKVTAQENELRHTLSLRKARVQNYLFFSGRCEEALNYYQEHLGARIQFLMRFNESPEPLPADMLQAGFETKIMHAQFSLGDSEIYASDGCDAATTFSGFSLSLTLQNEEDAHKVFDALAAGGEVRMPLAPTFWSPLYGQVNDKFGVNWMVMLPMPQAEANAG